MQTYHWWVDVMNEERMRPSLPKSSLKVTTIQSQAAIPADSFVQMQDSYSYYDKVPIEREWWADEVHGFHEISLDAKPVKPINDMTPRDKPTIEYAEVHKAASLDSSTYLRWLQQRAASHGVMFVRASFADDDGLDAILDAAQVLLARRDHGKADMFINATGLAARKICADAKVIPIQGQTILVRGEAKATRTRVGDNYISYCIPRPGTGTTILEGTKEVGKWDTTVDPEVTSLILSRLTNLAPELRTSPDGNFEVISVQCGLRPGREGGARVELELIGGHHVVHSYGHGAAVFQNSIGCAREVVRLVEGHSGWTRSAPRSRL